MPSWIGLAAGAASGIAGAAGAAGSNQAAVDWAKQQYAMNQANFQPYMTFGNTNIPNLQGALTSAQGAVNQYSQAIPQMTTPYGMSQYQKSPLYTPMVNNLAQLQATPGYQMQLNQGLQTINNSAAAKGGLLSGANEMALNNYAQQQAATGFQNAWQRAQSAYQNAFNQNLQTQQQQSNVLGQNANLYNQNVGNYQTAVNTGLNAANALAGSGAELAGTAQKAYANVGEAYAGLGQIGSTFATGMNAKNDQGYTGWEQIGNYAGGIY